MPSTIEGLSIALLEAMIYKLPIIASDIPANRELLDQDDALWHTPEDINEMAECLSVATHHKDIFYRSVEKNYKRVAENYTWDKVTIKYIRHLESIR